MRITYSQSIPKCLDPETGRFRSEIESPTSLDPDQLAILLRRPLMTVVHQVESLHDEDLMDPIDCD